MWHTIAATSTGAEGAGLAGAWRKVNEQGRIIGRINLKEGEYSASKVVVDDEGVGHSTHVGFYLTLDNAKQAVDQAPNVI